MNSIGGTMWSRFLRVGAPFFQSEQRWKAAGLLTLLIALVVSISGLNVFNSYVGRDFMTAIAQREATEFYRLAPLFAAVFVASTLVAGFKAFTEQRLGLLWRWWLTEHLTGRYLAGRAYYWIKGQGDVDNPDQRIAEDVKTFTTETLALVLILLNCTVTLCAFAGVLWSITPWLFLAAVGYAAFGSLWTMLLGRRLVGLNIVQLKREANLRSELIRVREHGEPIALLGGEEHEKGLVRRRLGELVENMKVIIRLNRNLAIFKGGYNYMVQIIPVVIAAPLYVRGQIPFGAVTQAAMAFSFVLTAFSVIITEFQRISTFAAVTARLGAVWEATGEPPASAKPAIEIAEDRARLAYERLTLVTPDGGRLLVKDLQVEVPQGKRLLIRGPDGAGRSTLLRATAGLWRAGEGRIHRPPLADVLFLPQQPYLVRGTLRDQLLYAGRGEAGSDERIRAVLRQVGFEPILERGGGLDGERDWPSLLSLSEQQLVAFARLLLASPRFAFLDEATSALDARRAEGLYQILSQTGITYISVADQPSLVPYHDLLLELQGDGGWRAAPVRSPIRTNGHSLSARPLPFPPDRNGSPRPLSPRPSSSQ